MSSQCSLNLIQAGKAGISSVEKLYAFLFQSMKTKNKRVMGNKLTNTKVFSKALKR